MNIKNSFHPYAIITIIFWSLAYVLTRLTLQYFTAFSLGFLRYFIASCTLMIVAVLLKMKLPSKEDFLWFVSAGGAGFFFYMIAFNQGQAVVTAATASVAIATVPVITALCSRFLFREELTIFQWIALPVEFFGVTVLTLMNSTFSVNMGLFWLLLAALALSIYNLLQRKLTRKYSSLQTSTFSIFCGTLMLSAFAPASIQEISLAPPVQCFYLAILGICCSAIAYCTWSKAFSKAKQTSQVSNYMFVIPFLTSLLGFLLAGEIPDRATLVGGGVILIGMLIFNFGEKLFIKIR
ncbi:MAG: DMT family transporter [Epulopiscium sp.]|jgi:drug/metabolite transporter (DMT)-like permease|nr:DMT family transporter [Candidatus Epulonipiscium sp.]